MGTAFCLKQRGDIKVTGLTSKPNRRFVERTGFYDQVEIYDTIEVLDPKIRTAIIDMAGNGNLTGQIYSHFGDNIVYNCMVGKSHWQGATPPKVDKGAPPTMFFAPDRAKLRIGDGARKGLPLIWRKDGRHFAKSAGSWLSVSEKTGAEHLLKAYKDFLDGQADPSKGLLFSL